MRLWSREIFDSELPSLRRCCEKCKHHDGVGILQIDNYHARADVCSLVSVWRLNRRARNGRDDSDERMESGRKSGQLGLSGFFLMRRLTCPSRPLHRKQHTAEGCPQHNMQRQPTEPPTAADLSDATVIASCRRLVSQRMRAVQQSERPEPPSAEAHHMSLQHAQQHARRAPSSRPRIHIFTLPAQTTQQPRAQSGSLLSQWRSRCDYVTPCIRTHTMQSHKKKAI